MKGNINMKRICIVVCIMLLWAALSLQAGAVSVRTASVEAIGAEEEEDEDAEAKIYWEEIDNRITAQDFIYDKLQKHVERFSFHYGGYDSFSMYDALHYNLSSENDYIKWNIRKYTERDYPGGQISVHVEYLTTKEEENELSRAAANIVAGMSKDTGKKVLSDYQKAILIYDWLCDHVTYVEPEEDEKADMHWYSAYGALVSSRPEATCQGFALAFCRLAEQLKLHCQIAVGTIIAGDIKTDHMWNIVTIDDHPYYVDAAHGAAIEQGEYQETEGNTDRYSFFMFPSFFEGIEYRITYETREDPFKTTRLYGEDIENVGTVFLNEDRGEEEVSLAPWLLDPLTGTLYFSADSGEESYILSRGNWRDYTEIISTVIVAEGYSEIEKDAFRDCRSLHAVYLPDSITKIDQSCFEGCSSEMTIHCSESSAAFRFAKKNKLKCHTSLDFHPDPIATCTMPGKALLAKCECGARFYKTGAIRISDNHLRVKNGKCLDCGVKTNAVAGGVCGRSVRWSLLTSGELILSGTGRTDNYSHVSLFTPKSASHRIADYSYTGGGFSEREERPWDPFLDRITKITVESGVTGIGSHIFCGCTQLAEVSLPDTLLEIGEYAFFECVKLKSLRLPPEVNCIGERAFAWTGIESVFMPRSAVDDNAYMIYGLEERRNNELFAHSALRRIEFEPGTVRISGKVCALAESLAEIVFPDSVRMIGDDTFLGCRALRHVSLPPTINLIMSGAFFQTGLTDILFPSTLYYIGMQAFAETPLSRVVFRGRLPHFHHTTFEDCGSLSTVFLTGSGQVFKPESLKNLSDLTLHCRADSEAALLAPEYGCYCHTDLRETVSFQEATCAESGNLGLLVCNACHLQLTEPTVLPRLAHTDTLYEIEIPDGVCDYCGTEYCDPTELLNTIVKYNGFYLRLIQLEAELYHSVLDSIFSMIKLFLNILNIFSS